MSIGKWQAKVAAATAPPAPSIRARNAIATTVNTKSEVGTHHPNNFQTNYAIQSVKSMYSFLGIMLFSLGIDTLEISIPTMKILIRTEVFGKI